MKITKKTSKISMLVASAMCSLLVLAIISPNIESSKALTVDHTYYLQQYIQTDDQLETLITQTSAMEKQLSDLKTTNTPDSNVKIQQLQQQIDANKNKRQSLVAELDHIQDESRALFQVDPATKKKLDNAQMILDQMYLNRTSETYVGDNPVQEIAANYEHKTMWVSFDPDKTINNPSGDTSKSIIANIKKIAGDIPLSVDYGKLRLLTQCSVRDGVCSPLLGGDAEQASSKTFPCTEGYPASDASNNPGFITAGHCSTSSATVNQPQPGKTGSRQVGTVTAWQYDGLSAPNFDFGFVKTSVSRSSWIFKDGLALFAINANTPQSGQQVGDIIKKSGYGTNNVVTTGTIISIDSLHHITATMSALPGDSGAPVFKDLDGTDVNIYGMADRGNSSVTIYFPDDFINSQLGLH